MECTPVPKDVDCTLLPHGVTDSESDDDSWLPRTYSDPTAYKSWLKARAEQKQGQMTSCPDSAEGGGGVPQVMLEESTLDPEHPMNWIDKIATPDNSPRHGIVQEEAVNEAQCSSVAATNPHQEQPLGPSGPVEQCEADSVWPCQPHNQSFIVGGHALPNVGEAYCTAASQNYGPWPRLTIADFVSTSSTTASEDDWASIPAVPVALPAVTAPTVTIPAVPVVVPAVAAPAVNGLVTPAMAPVPAVPVVPTAVPPPQGSIVAPIPPAAAMTAPATPIPGGLPVQPVVLPMPTAPAAGAGQVLMVPLTNPVVAADVTESVPCAEPVQGPVVGHSSSTSSHGNAKSRNSWRAQARRIGHRLSLNCGSAHIYPTVPAVLHPPFGNLHSFHQETLVSGWLSPDCRTMTKETFPGRLSIISESEVHSGGVHHYAVQFSAGDLSSADGVGFVFSNRLPCSKNIQRIVSVFVNRVGRICFRVNSELHKLDVGVKRLEIGDWVGMSVDLDDRWVQFTVWPADGESDPVSAEFNFGAILEMKKGFVQDVPKVLCGHLTCVVKNLGVTVTLGS